MKTDWISPAPKWGGQVESGSLCVCENLLKLFRIQLHHVSNGVIPRIVELDVFVFRVRSWRAVSQGLVLLGRDNVLDGLTPCCVLPARFFPLQRQVMFFAKVTPSGSPAVGEPSYCRNRTPGVSVDPLRSRVPPFLSCLRNDTVTDSGSATHRQRKPGVRAIVEHIKSVSVESSQRLLEGPLLWSTPIRKTE